VQREKHDISPGYFKTSFQRRQKRPASFASRGTRRRLLGASAVGGIGLGGGRLGGGRLDRGGFIGAKNYELNYYELSTTR